LGGEKEEGGEKEGLGETRERSGNKPWHRRTNGEGEESSRLERPGWRGPDTDGSSGGWRKKDSTPDFREKADVTFLLGHSRETVSELAV